jgi:hypothetical protein
MTAIDPAQSMIIGTGFRIAERNNDRKKDINFFILS